jgi:hypothetical protein
VSPPPYGSQAHVSGLPSPRGGGLAPAARCAAPPPRSAATAHAPSAIPRRFARAAARRRAGV